MAVKRIFKSNSGQALVETALVLPVLLTVIFNIINFSFFVLVALNIATAPRTALEYGILGFSTPAGEASGLPSATPATSTSSTVTSLAYQDMYGALGSYASAQVQVCSSAVLVSGSGIYTSSGVTRSNCVTCTNQSTCGSNTSGGSPLPSSDPESPYFVLSRVDVTYTFSPIITGSPFNLATMPVSICTSGGSCTFHRQLSMRSMN